jgi:glutaminyl-peptide cyclotransferase
MRFHRARVLRRLPHPGRGFTQGLITDGATVWESTGLYGQSALRRYRLGSGQAEALAALPPELFGEGICRVGEQLWQLTWQERIALRWQADNLELLGTVAYNREGWGICHAGDRVLTSDGSSELVSRDPQTLEPLGLIKVRCDGQRVGGLNDLEWAGGRVWANMLGSPYLVGIDPASGEVTDVAAARLGREHNSADPQAVLNGIAALGDEGEFLLTGKTWRYIHHVRLVESRRRVRPPAGWLTR